VFVEIPQTLNRIVSEEVVGLVKPDPLRPTTAAGRPPPSGCASRRAFVREPR